MSLLQGREHVFFDRFRRLVNTVNIIIRKECNLKSVQWETSM